MENVLNKRGVKKLYHFTQASNLHNIIEYGLLPRDVLEEKFIHSNFNDENRYDKCADAICLSIEFPNYKMLYKLMNNKESLSWVLIEIDSSIICNLPCAFNYTNAGDSMMYNKSVEERMGKEALEDLFSDKNNTRGLQQIPEYYPTNPQAEVLLFGRISLDWITCIIFPNEQTKEKYCHNIPQEMKIIVDYSKFKYRKDYMFW